jgi:hypothetical protein
MVYRIGTFLVQPWVEQFVSFTTVVSCVYHYRMGDEYEEYDEYSNTAAAWMNQALHSLQECDDHARTPSPLPFLPSFLPPFICSTTDTHVSAWLRQRRPRALRLPDDTFIVAVDGTAEGGTRPARRAAASNFCASAWDPPPWAAREF